MENRRVLEPHERNIGLGWKAFRKLDWTKETVAGIYDGYGDFYVTGQHYFTNGHGFHFFAEHDAAQQYLKAAQDNFANEKLVLKRIEVADVYHMGFEQLNIWSEPVYVKAYSCFAMRIIG